MEKPNWLQRSHVKHAMCLLIYFNMYANTATTKMLCWLLIWVPLTYNLNWTQRGWVQGKKPCKNICFYWIYEYPRESPFFIRRTEYICRAEMAKGGSAQATWEHEQLPDRHASKGWLLSQGQLWRLGKCISRPLHEPELLPVVLLQQPRGNGGGLL